MKRLALALALVLVALPAEAAVILKGYVEQGSLVTGHTDPKSTVMLDGKPLMVSPKGLFAFAFGRDHGPRATLIVTMPDGTREVKALTVAPRKWVVQSLTGVDQKYVTPPPEVQERIKREKELKLAARVCTTNANWFAEDFIWPAKGPISSVFGSQRIFNGMKKNPHFGVDVAAPQGTQIVAPADGIIRLAQPDMFFEGGLVFIDHGQGVTTQYLHMSRVDVRVDQRVRQGDTIGAVGKTGRVTGAHLHWGMNWCGVQVDPSLRIAGIGPKGAESGMKVGGE
ncbi:MAG: M23 family metallopeptidase [Parvibaculum sp.]|nr:M23 family metallopeptidase [Parvibaculum sp.]